MDGVDSICPSNPPQTSEGYELSLDLRLLCKCVKDMGLNRDPCHWCTLRLEQNT